MDNWRPWSTEVFVPAVHDTYNERATLHTFAELSRAAEDARSSLMSARWSRCCKLEAIAQQEERHLEATRELRELQPPAVEPPLPEGQWDLRALAECDTQLAREEEDWERRRANAVTDSASAPDWRTDVRYRLPPTPALGRKPYHDCTLREIWDYITDRGQNADPRDVEVLVEDPAGDRLDPRTSGAYLQQDASEMLEESGRLIGQLPSGVVITPSRRRKRNAGVWGSYVALFGVIFARRLRVTKMPTAGRQWVNLDMLRR